MFIFTPHPSADLRGCFLEEMGLRPVVHLGDQSVVDLVHNATPRGVRGTLQHDFQALGQHLVRGSARMRQRDGLGQVDAHVRQRPRTEGDARAQDVDVVVGHRHLHFDDGVVAAPLVDLGEGLGERRCLCRRRALEGRARVTQGGAHI